MMTLNEVSSVYGMNLSTMRRKASMKEIPITKIGGRVYVYCSPLVKQGLSWNYEYQY